jgi:hypothetical protein
MILQQPPVLQECIGFLPEIALKFNGRIAGVLAVIGIFFPQMSQWPISVNQQPRIWFVRIVIVSTEPCQ